MRYVAFLLLSAASLFAYQQTSDVQALIDEGRQAFRQAHYKEAAEAFGKAVEQEPSNVQARLELANAYAIQWVPGFDSEENQQNLTQATAEYNAVLQLDASNKNALSSLARLAFNSAAALKDDAALQKLDYAAELFRGLATMDPSDAEAFYYLGVIAWAKSFPSISQARSRTGVRPDDPGPLPDAALRQALLDKYGTSIEEGIGDLKTALTINPENADAMSYMGLLLRERAALRGGQTESEKDVAEAERWNEQARETKRQQAQSAAPRSSVSAIPSLSNSTPLPPPPQPTNASSFTGIRIGPQVAEANLVRKVTPIYPALAKAALVQGVVEFQVLIGKDGTVRDLRLMRGHPLLVQAAKEAVQRYVYRPTLLNGQPVEVVTEVDVTFSISR